MRSKSLCYSILNQSRASRNVQNCRTDHHQRAIELRTERPTVCRARLAHFVEHPIPASLLEKERDVETIGFENSTSGTARYFARQGGTMKRLAILCVLLVPSALWADSISNYIYINGATGSVVYNPAVPSIFGSGRRVRIPPHPFFLLLPS